MTLQIPFIQECFVCQGLVEIDPVVLGKISKCPQCIFAIYFRWNRYVPSFEQKDDKQASGSGELKIIIYYGEN